MIPLLRWIWETEYQIQTELRKLENVTKLIIAHRISAVRHADETIILKDGQIAGARDP